MKNRKLPGKIIFTEVGVLQGKRLHKKFIWVWGGEIVVSITAIFLKQNLNNYLIWPSYMIPNWKVGGFWGVATWSSYPPLWLNFGWISGLEKYVMSQHKVCLFSRNVFDFVCFPRFFGKKTAIFGYFLSKWPVLVGNRQSPNSWQNEKFGSWKYFFIPHVL